MKEAIRAVWRLIPASMRHKFWRWLNAASDREAHRRLARFKPSMVTPHASAPLVVAGAFRSASGIGAAARSTYHALRSAGLDPVAVDITKHFTRVDLDPCMTFSELPNGAQGTLILHINAPEVPRALKYFRYMHARPWRVIGYWAWELPVFPKGWDTSLRLVSQLWTLSDYTARSLRGHERAPEVLSFPVSISAPPDVVPDRKRFGFADETFTVLTMADTHSSLTRKNPIGAIRAFRMAFGDRADRRLIVKTRNLDESSEAETALRVAIGEAPNITVLDGALTEADKWALLASVDALISLHRAEGFGMPLAEAMALGVPVVATGWSGNMSFMTTENSLPVRYSLAEVTDPFGIYEGFGGEWAEPLEADAAEKLKVLADDAELRRRIGAAAKASVEVGLGHAAIGEAMARALRAK